MLLLVNLEEGSTLCYIDCTWDLTRSKLFEFVPFLGRNVPGISFGSKTWLSTGPLFRQACDRFGEEAVSPLPRPAVGAGALGHCRAPGRSGSSAVVLAALSFGWELGLVSCPCCGERCHCAGRAPAELGPPSVGFQGTCGFFFGSERKPAVGYL